MKHRAGTRDVPRVGGVDWHPWNRFRLSGDSWRGPSQATVNPLFGRMFHARRRMRVGVTHEVFSVLDSSDEGRLLRSLLSDSLIEPVVIPASNMVPPARFERISSNQGGIWMHWASYEIENSGNETHVYVVTQLDENPVRKRLLVEDAWYRSVVGLGQGEDFEFATDGLNPSGAAFECLVSKALHCDLFVTDLDHYVDLDGETGFRFPVEPVTPQMAIPLIGLYLRWNGQYRLEYRDRIGTVRDLTNQQRTGYHAVEFFHIAVLAYIPVAREFAGISRQLLSAEDVERIEGLASTVTHRLEQLLRARDQMLTLLCVSPRSIEPAYLIGDVMDQILLIALAAVDATAEALNVALSLKFRRPDWTNDKFRNAAAERVPKLSALFEADGGGKNYLTWKCLSQLRNAIHARALTDLPHVTVAGDYAGRVLFPIPNYRLAKLREILGEKETLESWGIIENVTDSGGTGLFPGTFVEVLVSRTLMLLRQILTSSVEAFHQPVNGEPRPVQNRLLSFDERSKLLMLGLDWALSS